MRGNVFMGFVLIVIGFMFFLIGMRKRGAQFLAELSR